MIKTRIKRFGVLKTATFVAIFYFGFSLLIFIPMFGISSFLPSSQFGDEFGFFGSFFFLAAPFLYGIMGFIMTALLCVMYNLFASFLGGIEVVVEKVETEN